MSDKELTLLKKWLRTHDPEYVKKRKEYNESEKVKERRRKASKRRRTTSCAILKLLKKNQECTIGGKTYIIKNGRLVEKGDDGQIYVIRSDKKGNIYRLEAGEDSSLEDERYDLLMEEQDKAKLVDSLEKLFNGDAEIESAVCKKSVLEIKEIPPEELYWKKLDPDTKKKMLEKLAK